MLNEIELLDKQRVDAFARLDAREYARLCDAIGVDPEDRELYKDGVAMLSQEKEQKDIKEVREKHREFARTLARSMPNSGYERFLAETKERKIDISDLYSGTAQKRSLLFKFFPEYFKPGKSMDLRFRRDHSIGTIFRRMANYAKRRMRTQLAKEGVAGRYFEEEMFERLHPHPKGAAIYHGREHTADAANMAYNLAQGREFTANDKALFDTINAKAEFLSQVALLHDIDPTRLAGKAARVPATLAWMKTPEADGIMHEKFHWDAQRTEMAKAMIQRTEFPFDGAKVGEKIAMGFLRGKTPTYGDDIRLGIGLKEISEYYANASPAERYEDMVSKLSPNAREFVLREAPILSEFSDKGSVYFKKPNETLMAVEGLGNETTGQPESFLKTTSDFLGSIGNPKNFEIDVQIARKFGLEMKYPGFEDIANILNKEEIDNWRSNRQIFDFMAHGTDPEDGTAMLSQENGQKDLKELREKHREFERTLARKIPNSRYQRFIAETGEKNVDISDPNLDTAQKRSLLLKFFPEDFAPGKSRDLRSRGAHAIGTVFRGVLDYARRRMREQRQERKMGREGAVGQKA